MSASIGDLVKTPLDKKNLLASVNKVFDYIREHSTMDLRVLSDMVEVGAKM